jgi:hypothetical protein
MGCAFKKSQVTWKGFLCLFLLAILALPLQQQPEGVPSVSSIFVVAQAKLGAALPEQKLTFEIASLAGRADQTPQINPAVLRIDLKQNLLVWPNIADDLTRSPPPAAVQ